MTILTTFKILYFVSTSTVHSYSTKLFTMMYVMYIMYAKVSYHIGQVGLTGNFTYKSYNLHTVFNSLFKFIEDNLTIDKEIDVRLCIGWERCYGHAQVYVIGSHDLT